MNTRDLRFVKTEELIRSAFLSCACENTIENIHIKDICAKARISRNAFYSHYETKYDLLEAVYQDVERKILEELTPEIITNLSAGSIYDTTGWCIKTVDENREILRILSKCSQTRFREMISRTFLDGTLTAVYSGISAVENDTLLQLSRGYITDGLSGILTYWLEDSSCISREELAGMLTDISKGAVEYFYRKLDENRNVERR